MPRSRVAAAALVAALAVVGGWNAVTYPPGLGYDAVDHIAYAEGLREGKGLPDAVGEYYTPPGFYAVAAVAVELAERAGVGQPLRAVQLVNALLAAGTALLLLALGRELFPGRHTLHVAAVGLFAAAPLVPKAAAMFHPETLDLFLSTLALLLAARMLRRGDFRPAPAVALGAALGAAQLVRAFALWTVAVVVIALAAAALADRARRGDVVRAAAVAVLVSLLVAGPWYAFQARRYTNPIFDRPQVAEPLWERRPLAFYVDPGVPEVVTRPYRPEFRNRFLPTMYAEGWGDYFGVFAWRASDGAPDEATRRELVAQSVVGLLPAALVVAGWLALLWAALRRPLAQPPLLLVTLLPLAGLAGMLYFTVSYPTKDGDVIKATYMLTTAPALALCFGWAVERLPRRVRAAALAALTIGALVSLRFALHGSALGGLL